MSASPFTAALRELLAGHLARFEWRRLPAGDRRTAAVAVVVVPDEEGDAAVLLTLRAAGLRRHGGQWALPGGRLEAGETSEAGALRELEEEVGLALPPEQVLGCLDDFATRSGFVITPVVVWGAGDAPLRPDPTEVESVYRVPFRSPSCWRRRTSSSRPSPRATAPSSPWPSSAPSSTLPQRRSSTSSPRWPWRGARPGWPTTSSPSSLGGEGSSARSASAILKQGRRRPVLPGKQRPDA